MESDPSALLFELAGADGRLGMLRLQPGTGQGFARVAGRSLSHGRSLNEEGRRLIAAIAPDLRPISEAPLSDADVLRLLPELVGRHDPALRLTLLRRVPVGFSMPRWGLDLRAGRSSEASIWPFDAEVAGLRAGVRALIKREPHSRQEWDEDRLAFAGLGLEVAAVRGGGVGTLLAAGSPRVLRAGVEAELELQARGSDDAIRELGGLLGYPDCCVTAFLSLERRDDASLAAELLPVLPSAPCGPFTQWLLGPLALVSHAPCSVHCTATEALARRVGGVLNERSELLSAWHRLAARAQVIDADGGAFCLDVEGPLDGGVVVDAVRLRPGAGCAGLLESADDLVGRRLAVESGWLVAVGSPFRGVLASDHREREGGVSRRDELGPPSLPR